MNNDEPLLTRKELAAKLPLPERTIRYLTDRGRIPVIKLSPQIWRYVLTDVREAIAKCAVPAIKQRK